MQSVATKHIEIRAWGHSLGLRIPSEMARAAQLSVNARVSIRRDQRSLIIEPVTEPHLSLRERLGRFDPQRHSGEQMATTRRLGAEQW